MKYLKVSTDFSKAILPLNDAEKGRLFDMMLRYAAAGEEPSDFRGNERFIWPTVKLNIDQERAISEKRTASGCKGGKANGSKTKQNEAKRSKLKQIEAKEEKERSKEKEEILYNPPVSKDTVPPRGIRPSLEEVTQYCRERGNNVNPQAFIDFYSSNGWKVGKNPMKDWKACVRTWEQRERKPAGADRIHQRKYTAAELDNIGIDLLDGE